MKKVILSVFTIVLLMIIGCKGETKTETKTDVETTSEKGKDLSMATFGVRGNCSMCKTTIEKAAKSVDGVAEATWDVDKKSIVIMYDEYKATEKELHIAIANAGYDTELEIGSKAAYEKLPKCCQFESDMKMNQ